MKKIMKWLDEHEILYTYTEQGKNKCIEIMIKKDCVWINGFGQPMKYDKAINIYQGVYKTYQMFEKYEYSMTRKLKESTKADAIIEALAERFFII